MAYYTASDDDPAFSLINMTNISSPVDLEAPYSTAPLAGKTILITGAASGFGAAFARHWASKGAHIVAGDLNDAAGEALVAELRSLPGSSGHHFYQRCDVTSWPDQVSLFKAGVRASPTGRIDAVVAGAGIVEMGPKPFDMPQGLDGENPPPPKLGVLGVNLTGVMYTAHLALYWLRKNGEAEDGKQRDRHLLLVSSIAGVSPLPGQTEYTVSKHAVIGLFRALRGTAWVQGVRVNVLCPYFVKTSLLPWQGQALLAGGALGELEDVVDAATRLAADERVVGRGLAIGPRGVVEVEVDGEEGERKLVKKEAAIWEIYAHDYKRVDIFVWRYVAMINALKRVRGWVGTVKDLWGIYLGQRKATKARA
ncbi:hypothetical protein OQA88_4718 [Cercophora sp. LCS_1]